MTICYFGIYDPGFSRNKIYIEGLKKIGVEVVECFDRTPGMGKWFALWRKLKALDGRYDAVIVGYPGHVAMPLAKIFSKKPIVVDLLGSLYDAEKHSHSSNIGKLAKLCLVDFLAVKCADIILLESEAQKKYFESRFGASKKYKVLYTGSYFEPSDAYKPDPNDFTVIFRGSLTPESGIGTILQAADILRNDPHIHFKIVGRGQLLGKTENALKDMKLSNVELISRYLSEKELRDQYNEVSLALGQFEDNPRLSRTIPHKAFEAFALGVPYLSGDAEAIREIVTEGETGFFVPLADASALAQKIAELSKKSALLTGVSHKQKKIFVERFAGDVLAKEIVSFISYI